MDRFPHDYMTLRSHNLNAHWDESKAPDFGREEKNGKTEYEVKDRDKEELDRIKAIHSALSFPSMHILISSQGLTCVQ